MDKIKKRLVAVSVMLFGILMGSLSVFAESAGTANSAVTTAMQTVANDMIATGNAVIPIALTVVGVALVVVFGIRMFKRIAK